MHLDSYPHESLASRFLKSSGLSGDLFPLQEYDIVGGLTNHPSEKYARQIGSSPQVGKN